MARAWIITKDHLSDGPADEFNRVGFEGPRNAPESLLAQLRKGGGHHFRMYDDDGILYYEGRATWSATDVEEGAYGPLGDLGMPDAGCVRIDYTGHPEFNC